MTSKLIFKIYGICLLILFFILTLSILIPFVFFPSLIPIFWGEDTLWYEAILDASLNLLYGSISSTILALFISLITYQYDILRDEFSYYTDINNIVLMSRNALDNQDVLQLYSYIELHKQQNHFLDSKPYKKSLLHSKHAKDEMQSLIDEIESQIEDIKIKCVDVINETKTYNNILKRYHYSFEQMLICQRYTREYRAYSKKYFELSRSLEIHSENKKLKTQSIREPIKVLGTKCSELKNYLYYRIHKV